MYRFWDFLFPLSFRRLSGKNAAKDYVSLEEYDQAVACYERALELEPENITFKFELADIYFRKNKMEYEYLLREIVADSEQPLPNNWRLLTEN